MAKTYKKPTKKDWDAWDKVKKELPEYAKMSDEEMKKYRMFTLLKWMCNYETRSTKELTKEIWVTEPTLRDFMKWKYSDKTLKLVESRLFQTVTFLNEQVVYYKDVRDDKE